MQMQAGALELIAEGRMAARGMEEVEAARADGRWDAAYASASKAEVPPDLQEALDANTKAAAFFATLTGTNRYAILYRIGAVKLAVSGAGAAARRGRSRVQSMCMARTFNAGNMAHGSAWFPTGPFGR